MERSILIVGSTRGLGASLASLYASQPNSPSIFATARSSSSPSSTDNKNITYIPDIDVSKAEAGSNLVSALSDHSNAKPLSTVYITAGVFRTEDSLQPDYDAEVAMYKTCVIGPTMIVSALANNGFLQKSSKVVLVSSESGSITLRHESEGGGNYAHHASKSALNMCGKLLSLDLKDKGVAVGMVHPGFMRTEMTKGVGFDKFWDKGGAVTPDEAAKSLAAWVEKEFDIGKTGQYWAPRGPGDIGTAEDVLGPKNKLPTPLQLPW